MGALVAALALLALSAAAALATRARPRLATALGAGGAVLACALALVPTTQVLLGAPALELRLAWSVPGGSFHLRLDALSALFLAPILLLSALGAAYGAGYLRPVLHERSVASSWAFYDLLVASMALVTLAHNAVLFLVAWEVMGLASYFLVTFEDEHARVREAGWTYLVATHLGTAFVLALFVLLGRGAGSLELDELPAPGRDVASVAFLLAVVGFGTKAGFLPLHVWLPEAHPAAPTHVSALMSGVMIKTGIYGLVRTLTLLGPLEAWWGWLLVAIGATSGVLGVLFALAQHDLKRLLAYHSVENIGIIALGLGLGVVGLAADRPALAVLGFAGGLLHVVNHALFKGLLFLGAGAVLHATHTRDMDHLGGLGRRMPWTAGAFLVGAVAISGLPPLNGFVSELLVLLGAVQGVAREALAVSIPAAAVVTALALIGGLAAACFAKAYGAVFLGEPRSAHGEHARDPEPLMLLPMGALAACCAAIGLGAPLALPALAAPLRLVTGLGPDVVAGALARAGVPLQAVAGAALVLVGLAGLIALARERLLAGRSVGRTVTWDCGYARPAASMQYTSSSFAQPLVELFGALLRTRREAALPGDAAFPRAASFRSDTPDTSHERLFRPAFDLVASLLLRLRWLEHGRLHLYVLYIAVALVALLAVEAALGPSPGTGP